MTEDTPGTGTAPQDAAAPGAAAPGAAAAGADEQHRLRRDRERKMLLGVCAGLGRYTGIDPIVFRLVFVILLISGGTGALLYIAAWLMMPDATGGPSPAEHALNRRIDDDVAVTLLGVGLGLTALFGLAFGGFGQGTLVVLTVLTLGLLIAHGRGVDVPQAIRRLPQRLRRKESPPPPPPPPPPAATPPPAFGDGPVDLSLLGSARPGTREAPPGPDPAGTPYDPGPDPAGETTAAFDRRAYRARRRRRPTLTLLVIFLIAVEAGILWLLNDDGYVPGVEAQLLVSALITIGLGLMLAAFLGRGRGLVVLGTIATVALTGTASGHVAPDRFGTVVWRPAAAAEIDGTYQLTAGSATLDLTRLRLDRGESLRVSAAVMFGRLDVRVPDGSAVTVHGQAGVGDVQVGDHVSGGVRVRIDRVLETDRDLPKQAPRIELDVRTTLGDLEVRRVRG